MNNAEAIRKPGDLLPPLKWRASFLYWRGYPPERGCGFKGFSSPITLHFGPGHGGPRLGRAIYWADCCLQLLQQHRPHDLIDPLFLQTFLQYVCLSVIVSVKISFAVFAVEISVVYGCISRTAYAARFG